MNWGAKIVIWLINMTRHNTQFDFKNKKEHLKILFAEIRIIFGKELIWGFIYIYVNENEK